MIWALVVLLGVCGSDLLAQTTDSRATGRLTFQSLTFPPGEVGSFTATGTPTAVWRDLHILATAPERAPAVVLLRGAGGITANLADWAAEAHRQGFAVPAGSSGDAACEAGGVMAWERRRRKGARGRGRR